MPQSASLPDHILALIEANIATKAPKLQPYFDCTANHRPHLLLVTIPVTRSAIEDVLYCEENWDCIKDWYRKGKPLKDGLRNSRVEELAVMHANRLVDPVLLARQYRKCITDI